MALMLTSPGTVSRILWHFTGGPLWNAVERRQQESPKPSSQAFKNLISIVRTRELRLGSYQEVVRVRVPKRKVWSSKAKQFRTELNVVEELASAPVCCLADIPIMHLSYLASRYGKFAIGFHRESILAHGFNPVFYTLESAKVILSIHAGFTGLRYVDVQIVRDGAEWARQSVDNLIADNELDDSLDLNGLDEVESAADSIENYVDDARGSFEDFLGFVKTFTPEEFGTIYCEREWRALKAFSFSPSDIAMIVVPRKIGRGLYFERFTKLALNNLALPPTIPIVPWEDLIEH
jgi:hypothetical protein